MYKATPAESLECLSYSVEVIDSKLAVSAEVQDGVVYRWVCGILRDPVDQTFTVAVRRGVTDGEQRYCEQLAFTLPLGEWAHFPNAWFTRTLKNGHIGMFQRRGLPAPDPTVQIELELLIDAETELRMSATR